MLKQIQRVVPGPIKAALAGLSILVIAFGSSVLVGRLAATRRHANTDMLTGLANQRCFRATFERMLAYGARTRTPLAVVLFDVDHFKAINDTHGHTKGDEVLSTLGDTVARTLRASDFAGRYGGEEFVLLLPDTDEAGGLVAAEKLQQTLRAKPIAGIAEAITASFGVAATTTGREGSAELLDAADDALYRAKANGRDRIEVAEASVLSMA